MTTKDLCALCCMQHKSYIFSMVKELVSGVHVASLLHHSDLLLLREKRFIVRRGLSHSQDNDGNREDENGDQKERAKCGKEVDQHVHDERVFFIFRGGSCCLHCSGMKIL